MELAIKQFEGVPQDEILEALEAEAIEVIQDQYTQPFTEEELDAARAEFADNCKEMAILDDRIKAITAPLKEDKKKIATDNKKLIDELKINGKKVTGKVFLIPDYPNKVVMRYNEYGAFIDSRPFTAKERQLAIQSRFNQL